MNHFNIDIKLEFNIHDFWIGVFWKWKKSLIYIKNYGYSPGNKLDIWITIIPMFPIHIQYQQCEIK